MYTHVLRVYIALALASCVTFFGNHGVAEGLPAICAKMATLKIRTLYDPRLLPDQVETVENVLHQTNVFLNGRFVLPSKVELEVGYTGNVANRSSSQITVPFVYDNSPEGRVAAKDRAYRLPDFAVHSRGGTIHEYAHEIYNRNIKLQIKDYSRIYEESKTYAAQKASKAESRFEDFLEKYELQINQIDAEIKSWDALGEDYADDEILAQLWAARGQLIQSLEREKKLFAARPRSAPFDSPYNELFADLLAVAESGDPKIIYNVLKYDGMDEVDKRRVTLRDFSYVEDVRKWSERAPHVSLSPIRFYLWKDILSKPEYQSAAQRSLVVKKVFDAIVQELQARIQTRSFDLTPIQMNQRLLDRIKAGLLR